MNDIERDDKTPIRVPANRPTLAELLTQYDEKIHPLSKLYPRMEEEAFTELLESVAKNGQRDEIVLLDGRIADGRHLFCCAMALAIEPRFTLMPVDIDPLEFVVDRNGRRRQLGPAQKAAVAADYKEHFADHARERQRGAGGRHDPEPLPDKPSGSETQRRHDRESTTIAAKAMGAGIVATQRMVRIKADAPAVFEAVKSGIITSITRAMMLAQMDEAERSLALQHPNGIRAPRKAKVVLQPIAPPQLPPQNDPPLIAGESIVPKISDVDGARKAENGEPSIDPVLALIGQYKALVVGDQQRFLREVGLIALKPEVVPHEALGTQNSHAEAGAETDNEVVEEIEPAEETSGSVKDPLRAELELVMERTGITATRIADLLGVSKGAVSQFRHGKPKIGKDKRAELVRILKRLSK